VGAALVALLVTGLVIRVDRGIVLPIDGAAGPIDFVAGIAFWTIVTLLASALPVQLNSGVQVAVSTAPLMAATLLGGPTAGAIVAALGTFDSREIRGRVAWYGTLANHAAIVLPVIVAGLALGFLRQLDGSLLWELVAALVATLTYFVLNLALVSLVVVFRGGHSMREFWTRAETTNLWANLLTLAPLGWLMARMYLTPGAGWWTTLLFGVPLFTTRVA